MNLSRLRGALAGAIVLACISGPTGAQSAADGAGEGPSPLGGILSEVRLGVLDHDAGIIASDREDGYDVNVELLFASPALLRLLASPRPELGIVINSKGDTNQLYAGLAWTFDIPKFGFIEATFGGSRHDGGTKIRSTNKNNYGCKWAFRESVSLGVRLDRHQSVSIMLSHISNGGLCEHNDGLDNLGIRYGYRF